MASTTFTAPAGTTTVYISTGPLTDASGNVSDQTVQNVSWSAANESIGTIDPTTGTFNLNGTEGSVEITATGTTNTGSAFQGTGTLAYTALTVAVDFSLVAPTGA
jgi:hypothetical protein